MTQEKKAGASRGTVVITLILVAIFAVIFIIAFVVSSGATSSDVTTITADSYREEVDIALEGADPSIAEALIEAHNCAVCHVLGNGTVAPLFAGIATHVGERRPPLSAEQYLYESIMYPGRFVVEGFANAMPNNYHNELTQTEIGSIIAYLMTLDEEVAKS